MNMAEKITVRRGTVEDAAVLVKFNITIAMETEGKKLDPATVSSGVEQVMHRPELGMYVVAEMQSAVAGGLMITREWSDWRNGEFWWIQSVYVDPAYRNMGVFRAMYEYICNEAEEAGDVVGFRLYVERTNETALKAYRAVGMKETSYKVFEFAFCNEYTS